MPRHPWLDPTEFFFEGGPVGALLIHGFSGAPTEMRPLGEYLAENGYTVSGPLLPGHGTTVDDLAGRKWPEWAAAVKEAYRELAGPAEGLGGSGRCGRVFVVGLSLGTLLALDLAAGQSADRPVDGLVLVSPGIFIANPLIHLTGILQWLDLRISQESAGSDLVDPEADKRAWCYEELPARGAHQVNLLRRRVMRLLPSITAPTLVVMSRGDASLKFESGPYVIEHIASEDKDLVTLHNSGHNVLVDAERESVFERTAAFIARLSKGAPAAQM
jgi:carboxylesterase